MLELPPRVSGGCVSLSQAMGHEASLKGAWRPSEMDSALSTLMYGCGFKQGTHPPNCSHPWPKLDNALRIRCSTLRRQLFPDVVHSSTNRWRNHYRWDSHSLNRRVLLPNDVALKGRENCCLRVMDGCWRRSYECLISPNSHCLASFLEHCWRLSCQQLGSRDACSCNALLAHQVKSF